MTSSSPLVIHPETQHDLDGFVANPGHAVILRGVRNIGKETLARKLAAELLGADRGLDNHPGYLEPELVGDIFPVEKIRQVVSFFNLKSTGDKRINRVVLIADAERMNHAAQNALLKTLEEPPADSVLVLTTSAFESLIATIRSRCRVINIKKPNEQQVRQYFESYSQQEIDRAYLISDGRIGVMEDILTGQDADETITLETIKSFLGLSVYDQLVQIESFKDRAAAERFTYMLTQLAGGVLSKKPNRQWQIIMKASLEAQAALDRKANTKLVLTELVLSLR